MIKSKCLNNRIINSKVFFLLALIVAFACTNQHDSKKFKILDEANLMRYASGVRIAKVDQGYLLQLKLPWSQSVQEQELFLLWPDSLSVPSKFNQLTVIKTPVNKLITLSSTQWSPLLKLGMTDRILGISEAGYVLDSTMRRLLVQGKVAEVAKNGQIDFEKLVSTEAELVLYSPDPMGIPETLKRTGINLLPWPDYMENSPLGRAEWLRVLGYLTGEQAATDRWFDLVAAEYNQLKNLVDKQSLPKPTIIAEKAFNGQWYIPGGRSYLAKIFEDAGADYIWKDEPSNGSIPLDIETIIAKGSEATFWRISHASKSDYSYAQLLQENELYGSFTAFQNRKVILCNTLKNGYFERSQYEPNVVLADFIHILHPDLLTDHQVVYHELLMPDNE